MPENKKRLKRFEKYVGDDDKYGCAPIKPNDNILILSAQDEHNIRTMTDSQLRLFAKAVARGMNEVKEEVVYETLCKATNRPQEITDTN